MDADTVSKIANAIAWHFQTTAVTLIVIQVVLVVIAAAAGAYWGEYLKAKGKNLATKHDFDDLKEQLRANTELVEKVKSDINREDWAAREWTNLRRLKLEELLGKMQDAEDFLNFVRTESFYARGVHDRSDPIGALDTISKLYFPELTEQALDLYRLHHQQKGLCISLARDLMLDKQKPASEQRRGEIVATFNEDSSARFNTQIANARQTLKTDARKLLVDILGFK
jgi:hypothetical protein